MQRATGNLFAAEKTLATALTTLGSLIGKNPTDRQLQVFHAIALTEQAAQARAAGHDGTASSSAQSALHILEPILAGNPEQTDVLLATTAARLQLASTTADPHAAVELRARALATLQAVKADHHISPRLLALQVEALLASGSRTDAQPLVKRLWAEGYRDAAFVDALEREHIDYPSNPAFAARLVAATKQAADGGVAAQAGQGK